MSRQQHIIVVEDNSAERLRYAEFARELGLECRTCANLDSAIKTLSDAPADFLLTDIHLASDTLHSEGLDLIAHAHDEFPTLTIVAMSSDPNVVVFERATANGAHHFLKKPVLNPDDLAIALDLAVERKRTREAQERENNSHTLNNSLKILCPEGIVIQKEHLRLAESAARNPDIPVIILGETGTGKEEVAKLIHRKRRSTEGILPLVVVNCANLSEDLLESALFGHKKGAFSGATETTTGFVGEADGGILFLDEIHTLSTKCQQKLLRVLNDGSYQRLGDTRSLSAKFQVMAASTRDLDDEVEAGRFLIDLRMRLTGIEIRLPPLRDRLEDLRTFVLLFLDRNSLSATDEELNLIVARCRQFHWRGNVRQLFMALNVMAAISRDAGTGLRAANLPVFKTMFSQENSGTGCEPLCEPLAPSQDRSGQAKSKPTSLLEHDILLALREDLPFQQSAERYERAILEAALARHQGNMAQTCLGLRMGRSSFELKRKKFQLNPSPADL